MRKRFLVLGVIPALLAVHAGCDDSSMPKSPDGAAKADPSANAPPPTVAPPKVNGKNQMSKGVVAD